MRVALVHDWLTGMRGGERCLDALVGRFPDSEIFTLLHVPGSVSPRIESRPIHTSFVGRLPGAERRYRYYLPLFPRAVERFELRGFDLVLSTSHCVAKGVRPPPGTPHLCYCFTPMRYVWDLYDDYFGPDRAGPAVRAAMALAAPRLRRWDASTASRVDRFVAISEHIRDRIRRCYGRDAAVVYPPVDVDRFAPADERGEAYLIVSALVPYKRVDLAVRAFNRLGRPLVVVGDGPDRPRLEAMAGPTVTFTGRLDDAAVAERMARCRAFVFPANEDFGIAAVEAQAAGVPVIAYAAGGALETVVGTNGDGVAGAATSARAGAGAGVPAAQAGRRHAAAGVADTDASDASASTGVFFREQTVDALIRAVEERERREFDPAALRANAERFAKGRFLEGIEREVRGLVGGVR